LVDVGGGDASGHAGFIHVGLGTAERAEIRVQWPDGDQSPSYRLFANQYVVADRAKPQAAYGIQDGRAPKAGEGLCPRPQLAITSFTCMIGSIFV
jgi:hypothetical protein